MDPILPRMNFAKVMMLAAACVFATALVRAETPQRQRKEAGAIRVVTANVRFITPQDDGTGDEWANRKELCRDVLLAQDADLICMQEYRLAHHAFLAGALAGFEPAYPALTKDDSAVQVANMVFFSKNRFEKTGAGFFWYSDTPGAPLSQFAENTGHNRFVMWLRLRDKRSNREFLLCNTHFSAGGSERSRGLREKQAAMLASFVEKQPAGLPVIVTGDLNSTAAATPVRRLLESGLADTFAAVHGGDEAGRTAHNFQGAKISGKKAGKGGKIDFILASNEFKATAAEIIRDSRDGRYPSDHYFVSAEVIFKK